MEYKEIIETVENVHQNFSTLVNKMVGNMVVPFKCKTDEVSVNSRFGDESPIDMNWFLQQESTGNNIMVHLQVAAGLGKPTTLTDWRRINEFLETVGDPDVSIIIDGDEITLGFRSEFIFEKFGDSTENP